MYSELASYHDNFHARVRMGEFCGGNDCNGYFLSDVDTWHECSCNSAKGYAHPEAEVGNAYVITAFINGSETAIGICTRMDHGKGCARLAAMDHEGVRLRRIRTDSPAYQMAQEQVSTWADLWH